MVRRSLRGLLIAIVCGGVALHAAGQGKAIAGENTDFTSSLNQADRVEWFRDQGFGLFIHWSVDSQLGVTISHSLVGASEDYSDRFFNELPKTFDPTRFDPAEWARLARLAGARYVVFTTKHHSGFGMYDTKTTPFNVMNTPFHRDITAEVLKAFKNEGIAPGMYFSPDDFYWLHKNGKTDSARNRGGPAEPQSRASAVRQRTVARALDELWASGRALL